MILKDEIDIELWNAIKKNYEAGNYTGSISDSVIALTNIIRNKTGLEGDGVNLIGNAFGGENPRIKLNKLQTDSEKDAQRGIADILRGIYTGIRNPRSHDAITDEKDTADAIIIFINYLLKLIDKSKLSFDEDSFMARIFDPYYVRSREYSDLLVADIPKRQRANIAIATVLRKNEGNIYSLGHFLSSLLSKLDAAELSRVFQVISDELRTTTEITDIRYLVHMCPGNYWPQINPAVRIRIESILYEDFSNGTYYPDRRECGPKGALATWLTAEHLERFGNIEQWTNQAINMIKSKAPQIVSYIDTYFWDKLCQANRENISWSLRFYFQAALKNGTEDIVERLAEKIRYDENHPWWTIFKEDLKKYPEIKYEEIDLPF